MRMEELRVDEERVAEILTQVNIFLLIYRVEVILSKASCKTFARLFERLHDKNRVLVPVTQY